MEIMKCKICWKEIKKKNAQQKYCIKCWNLKNRENTIKRYKKKGR